MLPSGYTQLTYIESRGSGYVITNLKDTDDYDELYLGFKDFASQTGSVMGAISSAATGCEIRWNTTSGTDYNNIAKAFGYRKNSLNADNQPTGNGYYRFYFSGSDAYIDLGGISQVKLNGTSTLTGYKIALFGRNTSNGGSVSGNTSYKLTEFWAKKSGVYVVNYVPCKRDSDSVLGIYDLVNNEFISGDGTLYSGYEISIYSSPSGGGSISANLEDVWETSTTRTQIAPQVDSTYSSSWSDAVTTSNTLPETKATKLRCYYKDSAGGQTKNSATLKIEGYSNGSWTTLKNFASGTITNGGNTTFDSDYPDLVCTKYRATGTGRTDLKKTVGILYLEEFQRKSKQYVINASPNTGYQFDHFDVNGTTYTTNPLTLTITQNSTITAYFKSTGGRRYIIAS